MNTTKIGWIGLGNMGIPMSKQLLNAGFPLKVYNRNPTKTEVLITLGAQSVDSPAALLENCDIIFLMVSDDQAITDLFNGEKGLLTAQTNQKILINMSTVSPAISKEMALKCTEKGNYYLDAPVSGSVKQAMEARLVIMVGGNEAIYEKVKPILAYLGKMSMYVGEVGSGNSAKLAINTLLGIQAHALAETILFANEQNITTADLMTLINHSALGNVFMKIKGDAIINDDYKAAFALKHIAKDLRLAKAEGLSSPIANIALESYSAAEKEFGEKDIIAILKSLSNN